MAWAKSVCKKDWRSRKRGKPGDVIASPEAGRGMRCSRSDTGAASQAFERMYMHVSMWRKHALADGDITHS